MINLRNVLILVGETALMIIASRTLIRRFLGIGVIPNLVIMIRFGRSVFERNKGTPSLYPNYQMIEFNQLLFNQLPFLASQINHQELYSQLTTNQLKH